MSVTLEIFSQGEEIISGQTVDTNAAWLSQQVVQIGFTVTRHTAVGDKLDDLILLLKEITGRADCCICSGGLGPTGDDLTAEAVAQAFQRPLQFDGIAFAGIAHFFSHRNRTMPESNRKQAMLPMGAVRIDNHWGTAPGFSLQQGRCWFVFLPGVPMEMRSMFLESIQPVMFDRFALAPGKLVTLRVIGIGESDIQEKIAPVNVSYPVQLGFRADSNEVQVKLLFPPDYPEMELSNLVSGIYGKLGRYVFAVDGYGETTGDLVSVIDQLMKQGQHTLAVVETASQGLLAAKCIGASWLLETRYQQAIVRFGEKAAGQDGCHGLMETAKALASDLQKNSEADIVLVQLYAGTDLQFQDKEQMVTLICVLLNEGRFQQTTYRLAGSAERKQNQAAMLTLDLLRRYLQPASIFG